MASGLEFLGITDPAVDPDGVREIAKHWRTLAKGLEDAAHGAEVAMSDVTWEGETAKAFSKRARTMRKHATDTAHSVRDGATALDKFADEAHELITQIGVMVAEIAEFEIAGLALSVLTAGMSEVASTLVAGERALKVMALITRIEESGSALGATVRTALEAIRNVERALKALKEIKTVAKVGKLAGEGLKFTAFTTALEDPGAFKDPGKLAKLLTEGAIAGVGLGFLGKALGKGLKALKPGEIADLAKALKLNGSGLSRLKLRPSEWEKLPASIRGIFKECKLDPIDVATGDMLLPLTDIALPGVLPLVLERTHVSSYRHGGWFGTSWASTLDQRIQADDEGLIYAAPDGARLLFPWPDPESDLPVYPETGSRLSLKYDDEIDGALRLTDPDAGCSLVFHSPQPTDAGSAVDLPLQFLVDRNRNRITLNYNDLGVPVEVTHSGGYRIALDHHSHFPRITGIRLLDPNRPSDPGVTVVTFGYDDAGHLVEEINSSGLPLRYRYDSEGRITSWTDRNETYYAYTYDEFGRVVRTEGSGRFLTGSLDYDSDSCTTTVTDSLGHATAYELNDALRINRITDPLGHVTSYEWDEEHQLTAITDALGHTTRYSYDAEGRPVHIDRPDGRRISTEYDESGLPRLVSAEDGSCWRQEYDEHGNCIAVIDPMGKTTLFGYESDGRINSVTDALGHVTAVKCDAAGVPIEVIDPLGAATRYTLDAFGRPVDVTDPLGAVTYLVWTPEGKLVQQTTPEGAAETWKYDPEGNCTSHTDASGAITRFAYTGFDLMSVRIDPGGARYEFRHDTELRVTEVVNPLGQQWRYAYDAVGRLVSETDFDGRVVTYEHDPVGELKSRTNPLGQTTSYQRNENGQVTRKDAAGHVTSYLYDQADRLVQAANSQVIVTLERDRRGRVLSETVGERTLHHSYDGLGRRNSRTTPTSATSEWTHDAAGHRDVLTASGHDVFFSYDAAGREVERGFGTGLKLSQQFDAAGRLASLSVLAGGSRLVQRRAYSYSRHGEVVGIDDYLRGERSFDLGATGRITAVHARDWTETYAYDAAGNQADAHWPDTHPGKEARGPRSYLGTCITRAGNVRFEYDAAGRITLRQRIRLSRKPETWRYAWNAEDQLSEVITPDGTVWKYLYDPLGRRISKSRISGCGKHVLERVDFTWDGAMLCEQTSHSADLAHCVTLTWDYAGLHPISQTERITSLTTPQEEVDQRFFAIVTDLVGTPTELVDEAGEVVWHTRATLWGSATWRADSSAYTPLRFPGQYFDPETGFHYNLFRYYDPESARYVTPDPLGLEPDPNPRTYVDNPHTASDPLGLKPCKIRVSPVASDWATKGAHIHVGKDEVSIAVSKEGELVGTPIRLKGGLATNKSVKQAVDAVSNDPKLRADLIAKATSAREHMLDHNWGNKKNRADEMKKLIDKLESMP
nr:DUF6531 domain-containing protein [Streptomyces sp. SID10853]